MGSPYIQYDDLTAFASEGGYSIVTALDNLSAVFLLSACEVMTMRWLWESPLSRISDNDYQAILDMIAETVYELMTTFAIGQIISTINDISAMDNVLILAGQSVAQSDYPELTTVVPSSWLNGGNIDLPQMNNAGIFGKNESLSNLGTFRGENTHVLTVSEMPSHTHVQDAHVHSEVIPVVTPSAGGEIPALADLTVPTASVTGSTVATNQNTGGDNAHENVQRSLCTYWWIIAK